MFNMTTWFCDAYASRQKGGIENANGRLRRWLPRNLNIDALDEQELQDVVFTTKCNVGADATLCMEQRPPP